MGSVCSTNNNSVSGSIPSPSLRMEERLSSATAAGGGGGISTTASAGATTPIPCHAGAMGATMLASLGVERLGSDVVHRLHKHHTTTALPASTTREGGTIHVQLLLPSALSSSVGRCVAMTSADSFNSLKSAPTQSFTTSVQLAPGDSQHQQAAQQLPSSPVVRSRNEFGDCGGSGSGSGGPPMFRAITDFGASGGDAPLTSTSATRIAVRSDRYSGEAGYRGDAETPATRNPSRLIRRWERTPQ